jgi:S-DNA-T family DNA segregation ATPase FtsK/SpoIIIE
VYEKSILEMKASDEKGDGGDEDELDERYDDALALVAETKQASISMIQRRLRIGYNRAARIIEKMEQEGVVGPSDGTSKPREVFINKI